MSLLSKPLKCVCLYVRFCNEFHCTTEVPRLGELGETGIGVKKSHCDILEVTSLIIPKYNPSDKPDRYLGTYLHEALMLPKG